MKYGPESGARPVRQEEKAADRRKLQHMQQGGRKGTNWRAAEIGGTREKGLGEEIHRRGSKLGPSGEKTAGDGVEARGKAIQGGVRRPERRK
jgi:hypothetical protein